MAATASNLGKWDGWYEGLSEPAPYGGDTTYQAGADWLAGCSLVEDWGCGKGWLRKFVPADRYRGLDGSATPFAAETVDLADYRSQVPGIFMRHVLEHDRRWQRILDNAVASFTERMALVIFTPLADHTHPIAYNRRIGVPDIAFHLDDLTERFGRSTWNHEEMLTASQYGVETVFYLEAAP